MLHWIKNYNFSKVVVPFCIPTSYFTSLPTCNSVSLSNFSKSSMWVCSGILLRLNLNFLDDRWYRTSSNVLIDHLYMFFEKVSIQILYSFFIEIFVFLLLSCKNSLDMWDTCLLSDTCIANTCFQCVAF